MSDADSAVPSRQTDSGDAPLPENYYADDNLRLLAALGLYVDPEEEQRKALAEERKRLAKERKERRASGTSIASRRSSRVAGVPLSYKDIDMSVVNFDDPTYREPVERTKRSWRPAVGWSKTLYVPRGKEVYSLEHLNTLGDCEQPYPFMGEEKTYDPTNGTCCHQCRQKTIDSKVHCSKCDAIGSYFCGTCLQARYGENKLEVFAKMDTWLCPRCRGFCNCSMCRNDAGYGPTGPLAPRARQLGYKSAAHYLVMTNLYDPETQQKYALSPEGVRTDLEVIESRRVEPEARAFQDEDAGDNSEKNQRNEVSPGTRKRLEKSDGQADEGDSDGAEKVESLNRAPRKKQALDLMATPSATAILGDDSHVPRRSTPSFFSRKNSSDHRLATVHSAPTIGSSGEEETLAAQGVVLDDSLTVMSWGKLRADPWWSTDEFVLPDGWVAITRRSELRNEKFECEIVEHQGKPLFVVKSLSMEKRFSGPTPGAALFALLRSRGLKAEDALRDGMEWFGLLHPKVQAHWLADPMMKILPTTCYYGITARPKVRWQLKKGDFVAMRTPVTERDRYWIGRVSKAVAVPWSDNQVTDVHVQWLDRQSAKVPKYALLDAHDVIPSGSIFAAKFDSLMDPKSKDLYLLVHDLQHMDL